MTHAADASQVWPDEVSLSQSPSCPQQSANRAMVYSTELGIQNKQKKKNTKKGSEGNHLHQLF